MPRFFVEKASGSMPGDTITVTDEDARHISYSLRMRAGEKLCVCDFFGWEYSCEIASVTETVVNLTVLDKTLCQSEPSVHLTIYQALPKSDKFDSVIQKCTEIGACGFTPVLSSRCISRPDKKSVQGKIQRWQKIAKEAAKQSGRGIIPAVNDLLDYTEALENMKSHTLALMCYECEDSYSIKSAILDHAERLKDSASIAVLIGPEGGFSPQEAAQARNAGIIPVGLGKRILRTETAPVFATSAIMLLTGNAE